MATKEQWAYLHKNLLKASTLCSERCLYQSAKWLAELLSALPDHEEDSTQDSDSSMKDGEDESPQITSLFSTASNDPEESRLEAREVGKYLLAKSFFDCKEYDRCSAVFLPIASAFRPYASSSPESKSQTPTKPAKGKGKATVESPDEKAVPRNPTLPHLSQKSLFLALYAKYVAGEKRKNEESEMILGPADSGSVINKELVGIGAMLEGWFDDRLSQQKYDRNQGWLEYLYGIVLKNGNSEAEAKDQLMASIRLNPWLWCAWEELQDLLGSMEDLRALLPRLPKHIMTLFFTLHASQSFHDTSPTTHSTLNELSSLFPASAYLLTQRGLLHLHTHQTPEAEAVFDSIIHTDPHRLDSLDLYSNALYVQGNRPKVAFLAQLATATDLFRPETCVIVGNYYSMKSEHEKAVMYFRRALTLDRNCLSAWTLMGHEFVEMKNTHSAIESYRRAVDINRRDYRAWYGLGQTYEVLEMHHYALFYYQRAAALRPYDAQMWHALGSCYQKLERWEQAIKAYKRALVSGMNFVEPGSSFDSSGADEYTDVQLNAEILFPIAVLYERLGDREEAKRYMEMVVAQEEAPEVGAEGAAEGVAGGIAEGAETQSRRTSVLGSPDDDSRAERDRAERGRVSMRESLIPPSSDLQPPISTSTGPTRTTSAARMWLARKAFADEDWDLAMQLAQELCDDGFHPEEGNALVKDLRARMGG